MNLRYRKSGTLFIPQYQLKDGTWEDFVRENVGRELLKLCVAIGNIQMPSKWDDGQWYYQKTKQDRNVKETIIFTKEIFVMAFLGAAKVYFDVETKEFKL